MSATIVTVKDLIHYLQQVDPEAYVVTPYCDITLHDGEGSVNGFNTFYTIGYEARTGWYLTDHWEHGGGTPLVVMSQYHRTPKELMSDERGEF